MKRSDKINTEKIHNKKKNNDIKHEVSDDIRKETLAIITSVRTNIYQKIYRVINALAEDWRKFDFLSSESKVASFIEKLEKEIKLVKNNDFNFAKYKTAIFCILGKDVEKFTKAIIKNMYIAKLQNIIIIIKGIDAEGDEDLTEVKSSSLYM